MLTLHAFQATIVACLGIAITNASLIPHTQQKPLGGNNPVLLSGKNFQVLGGCSGSSDDFATCIDDVGNPSTMTLMVRVWDVEAPWETVCLEPLEAYEPATVVPPDIVFGTSSYTLESGGMTIAEFTQENPFPFTGWYGGVGEFSQSGYACAGSIAAPPPITVTASMQFNAATAVAGVSACLGTAAAVSNNSYLSWGEKDFDSCGISFSVTNGLSESATFGAVQVDYFNTYFLTISGTKYFLRAPEERPVLVPKNKKIVQKSKTIASGASGTVAFTSSAGMDLGNGCWRTSDGTASGTYESAGFGVNYWSFIMQNWDGDGANVAQVPLGGDSSTVRWAIEIQADLANGTWTADAAQSIFVPPAAYPAPQSYLQTWSDYAGNPTQITGSLASDGCYVLNSNPLQ